GKPLYSSFARFPNIFDKVSVNIVKASEEAGTLDVVLKDMRLQVQKDMEFIDKVKSALTYPIVIFFVFMAVMLLILIVVIPKIGTVFKSLRVSLPLPTQILIFMSDVITKNTLSFVLITVAVISGIIVFYKMKRSLVLHMLYSLPLVSTLIKQIDLTRFSRSMYLLLTSGITITSALDLAEDVVLRRDIAQSIAFAQETILSGKKLSEAFKKKKSIFPGIIIKIIEAGEKTGTLDKSMQDIAEYMDYQVSSTLKTVTTILEPLMLVVVGILVGGMMMSIIAPIYGLISQVGGR
ncbi:MAG: type II secretion system F family protein, partial [Patescibacteria group bacterium]|nr:type II secretion system F family protein [Patescibacteria group bacterium]